MRHYAPTRLLLLAAMLCMGLIGARNSSSPSSAAVVSPVLAAEYAAHGGTKVTGTVTNQPPAVTPGVMMTGESLGRLEVSAETLGSDGASGQQNAEEDFMRGGGDYAQGSTIKSRTKRLGPLSVFRNNPNALTAASVVVGLANLALLMLLLLQPSRAGRSVIRGAAGSAQFRWQNEAIYALGHILLPILIGLVYVWAYQHASDGMYVMEKEG